MEFEKIRELIADQLSIDVSEITENSSFQDDLEADSLDLFELIMAIEEEFNIEIPDDAVENIRTVGDAVEQIKLAINE